MGNQEIREPIQKRSIEKKRNIIKYGFELICEKGYHNTNTAEIAKAAGVSTGIVYQYFNDKRDIFLQGIEQYSKSLLFPITEISIKNPKNFDLKTELNNVIKTSVKNHKISESAHEEIYSLQHSDPEVAQIFLNQEIEATNRLIEILEKNNITTTNINEKAHLIVSIIDSLCHEIVYHKHSNMDYKAMQEIVIETILNLLK
ncbi:MAG: TetR/AcrR family transcriptional regulator [Clostridia bacterium]|nr:TetR/AcrR family transcriptional regulator [Clostridia bacterium]